MLTKYFFSLLLIACLPTLTRAQATDDNSNDRKVVEFHFGDSAFKQNLPFDQLFTIRFKDVPPAVTKIKIEFYEFQQKKYRKQLQKQDDITDAILKEAFRKYSFSSGTRFLKSDKDILMTIPVKLKPNSDYIFRIYGDTTKPISAAEKKAIRNSPEIAAVFSNFINEIAETYFTNQEMSNNALARELDISLNRSYAAELKNMDEHFYLKEIDNTAQINEISVLVNSFREINDKLSELEVLLKKDTTAKGSVRRLSDVKSQLLRTDFSALAENSADYNSLIDATDNITQGLRGQDSSVISSKKEGCKDAIAGLISARQRLTATLEAGFLPRVTKTETVNGTYRADFVKDAKLYIRLDAGLAYTWRIDRAIFYTGTNIYFRPINDNIPLSHYNRFGDIMAVRTSLLLGVTVSEIKKANVREGLIGNTALVLGAGFRLTKFLKINGGTMVYYSYNKNPLYAPDRKYTTFSPFVSLSLDMDVKPLVGGIGTSLFKQ